MHIKSCLSPLFVFLLAAGSLFIGLRARSATAQPQPGKLDNRELLKRLDEGWESVRAEYRAVAYRITGTSVIPKGAYTADGHDLSHDQSFAVGLNCVLDFSGGRFRIEMTDKTIQLPEMRLKPEVELWTYDVGDLRVHHRGVSLGRGTEYSERQPEFTFQTNKYPVLTLVKVPIFVAHGYMPMLLVGGDRQGLTPLRAGMFDVKGDAQIGERDCLVLRVKSNGPSASRVLDVWVDRTSGQVLRLVRLANEITESTVDIEYRSTNASTLAGWQYCKYHVANPKQPTRLYSFVVSDMRANPLLNNEQFAISPQIGMVVRDQRAKTTYVLGEGRNPIPLNVAFARKHSKASYPYGHMSAVAVVIVGGLGFATWLWYRRR